MTNADYITSDNAVVTAHVVSLRSPIEGLVVTNFAAVGDPVSAGTFLAAVTNSLADDRQVVAMRARLTRLHADLDAALQEQVTLATMLEDLTRRAANHRAAKLVLLALDTARTDRDRSAKQDQLEQMVRDMRRKVALRGTVSESDIEAAETAVRVAAEQVSSLDQQIDASQAAAQAADAGVLAEANSANDVAYSEQRADEVRERLADLTRTVQRDAGCSRRSRGSAARGSYNAPAGTRRVDQRTITGDDLARGRSPWGTGRTWRFAGPDR